MQHTYTVKINGIPQKSFEECIKCDGAYSGMINPRIDQTPINCIYVDDLGNFVAIK